MPIHKSTIGSKGVDLIGSTINITTEVDGSIDTKDLTVNKLTKISGNLNSETVNLGGDFICSTDLTVNQASTLNSVTLVNQGLKNNKKIYNVGNPSADTDLLNFEKLKTLSPKSVSSVLKSGYVTAGAVNFSYPGGSVSYSPQARDYFLIDGRNLYIYKPGLYQISYTIYRYSGRNEEGNDKIVTLQLRTAGFIYDIGHVDVRAWAGGAGICVSESLLIDIPAPGPIGSDTYFIFVNNTTFILRHFCCSVTWFPQKY